MQGSASISDLCALHGVSRSGYYAHLRKSKGSRRQEDKVLGDQLEAAFRESRETYGSPRLVAALRDQKTRCGKNRVRRLMIERGLTAKKKRAWRPCTTDSSHRCPVAPNLLREAPLPTRPDQQWVSDITYVPTREGWLYVAGTLDRCSRRVVGWQASSSLERDGVMRAARCAFEQRRPAPGLIYHSDRGSQYASYDCRTLLAEHDAAQSMSRSGNCYDNAMMESFWATLKTECFGDYIPATRLEATTMLFDYIETFYNNRRKHSALGYVSPAQYEANLLLLLQTT